MNCSDSEQRGGVKVHSLSFTLMRLNQVKLLQISQLEGMKSVPGEKRKNIFFKKKFEKCNILFL